MDAESAEDPKAHGGQKSEGAANGMFGRVRTFVRDQAWQCVGAVASIIAIVVTLLLAIQDDKKTQQTEISGNISDGCAAIGIGNQIDCDK